MEVLPYFLPEDEPSEQETAAAPPHSRPYFLCVGRLEVMKGFDEVIPLLREFPESDLLIAGEGEQRAALQKLAGPLPNVKFLGWVSPDQLHRYYRSALALIVPSAFFETFGIILIEAFRASTPVIARRIGPLPEIVEECGGGLLFDTTQNLRDAMKRILTDPNEREHLARSGRRGFLERWSESAVVPRYLDVIHRAAESKQRTDILERIQSG
jgi:glycosyltransferase involved in cell wall biosynthesis